MKFFIFYLISFFYLIIFTSQSVCAAHYSQVFMPNEIIHVWRVRSYSPMVFRDELAKYFTRSINRMVLIEPQIVIQMFKELDIDKYKPDKNEKRIIALAIRSVFLDLANLDALPYLYVIKKSLPTHDLDLQVRLPNPDEIVDSNRKNIIHIAFGTGDLLIIDLFFNAMPERINTFLISRDINGGTPLHFAAFNGRFQVFDILRMYNVDVSAFNNLKDGNDDKPSDLALRKNHEAIANWLLEGFSY